MIYTIRILFIKAFIKMCVTSLLFAWLSMFVMSCRHLAAITVHNVQITQIGQLLHSFSFYTHCQNNYFNKRKMEILTRELREMWGKNK